MMNIYFMEIRQRYVWTWDLLLSIVLVKWKREINGAVTVIKCVINGSNDGMFTTERVSIEIPSSLAMAGEGYTMAYNGSISTSSVLYQTMQKLLRSNTF